MECLVSVDWALLEEATALLASGSSHPTGPNRAVPEQGYPVAYRALAYPVAYRALAYPVAYRASVPLAEA